MEINRQGQDQRELALRKYFKGLPQEPSLAGAMLLSFAGLAGALVSFIFLFKSNSEGVSEPSGGTTVFAVFCLIVAGVGLARRSSLLSAHKSELVELQPQPAEAQVDKWFQESINTLCDHSREILNITKEEAALSTPLFIVAPTLGETHGVPQDEITWRKGLDGGIRFAIHKVAIIHLTDRHLGAFICDFNFIRNVPLNESTQEYHYCDVVSVSTIEKSQAYTLRTGEKLITSKVFALSVASGESIQVPIDVEQLRRMTGLESPPETGADQAVSTIRTMLRDKKGSRDYWRAAEYKAS
jgi:hypothetical protein